jgi:hypothetical protein
MNATLELPVSLPPANGRPRAMEPPISPPSAANGHPAATAASQRPAGQGPPGPGLLRLPIFCRGIPSARDREIFRQVVVCRRTKTDVAREHRLSQPRVTQICDDVKKWMKEHTEAQAEEMNEPQRLNLAENLCRQRLETQYALAMEAFEASREPRQWSGWDEEGNPIEPPRQWSQRPQSGFLNTAIKATIELARLDGVWGSGDAWAGRNREKLAEFQEPRNARWDAQTAQNEAILADMRAFNQQQMAQFRDRAAAGGNGPAAAPAGMQSPPDATYERLCNSPPAAPPDAEVAAAARGASDAAADLCSDGPERNLSSEVIADRLQKAYAPPEELAQRPAARQSRRLPPADREKAFHRQRSRKELLAPLSRLVPQSPPALERVNGHPQSGP